MNYLLLTNTMVYFTR